MFDIANTGRKPDHLTLPMVEPAPDLPVPSLLGVISMTSELVVPAYTITARILH